MSVPSDPGRKFVVKSARNPVGYTLEIVSVATIQTLDEGSRCIDAKVRDYLAIAFGLPADHFDRRVEYEMPEGPSGDYGKD